MFAASAAADGTRAVGFDNSLRSEINLQPVGLGHSTLAEGLDSIALTAWVYNGLTLEVTEPQLDVP